MHTFLNLIKPHKILNVVTICDNFLLIKSVYEGVSFGTDYAEPTIFGMKNLLGNLRTIVEIV